MLSSEPPERLGLKKLALKQQLMTLNPIALSHRKMKQNYRNFRKELL